MNEYDLFREFPDGQSVWVQCCHGRKQAEERLKALVGETGQKYYAINLYTRETIQSDGGPQNVTVVPAPVKSKDRHPILGG